jgi:hypothetical protein
MKNMEYIMRETMSSLSTKQQGINVVALKQKPVVSMHHVAIHG